MKNLLLATAFGMIASLAHAGITADQVAAAMTKAGYTNVEVKSVGGQMKAEGIMNGAQVEVIYDIATGQIISQSSHSGVKFDSSGSTTGVSSGTSGDDVGDDVGDDNGGLDDGSDDAAGHDANDDNGGSSAGSDDAAGHDAGDDNGGSTSGSGESGASGKGGSDESSDD